MSHSPELLASMRAYLDRFDDAGLRAVINEDPATQPDGMSWDGEIRALAKTILEARGALGTPAPIGRLTDTAPPEMGS